MLFLILQALSSNGFGQEKEPNTIEVIGIRKETNKIPRAGKSESVNPQVQSRFNISDHVKDRSYFELEQTGRVSSSGLAIPRTRGQDSKATSLFVEDYPIFDPQYGIPMAEEIDLKALGRMEVHRGVSPISLRHTNPIGSLVIKSAKQLGTKTEVGGSYGEPWGQRGFLYWDLISRDTQLKQYIRYHKAEGDFAFYDINGTPENLDDDRTRKRKDNQYESWQYVPQWGKRIGNWQLDIFGIFSGGKRGIPALGGRTRTFAYTKYRSQMLFAGAKYQFAEQRSWILPNTSSLRVSGDLEFRQTYDPEKAILVTSDESRLETSNYRAMLPQQWDGDFWMLILSPEVVQSNGNKSTDGQLSGKSLARTAEQFYSAFEVEVLRWFFEVKHRVRNNRDSYARESQSIRDQGSSIAVGYREYFWQAYWQYGTEQRPPALFELYGDGSALLANLELTTESFRHHEFGGQLQWANLEFGFAYFIDKGTDKIVLIPNFLNSFKAVNLGNTEVTGKELDATMTLGEQLIVSMGYSKLEAFQIGQAGERDLRLPSVPEDLSAARLQWQMGRYGLWGLGVRRRGRVYFDLGNQIYNPPITTYDLSYDKVLGGFSLSGQISNLTDVKSVDYPSPSGGKARRPYSELSGYPLPGRSWQVAVVYSL